MTNEEIFIAFKTSQRLTYNIYSFKNQQEKYKQVRRKKIHKYDKGRKIVLKRYNSPEN